MLVAQSPPCQSAFERTGFVVCRGALPSAVARLGYEYGLESVLQGFGNAGDEQVPGSPAFYDDPLMRVLHLRMTAFVEQQTGRQLWPTYCYMRHYNRGAELHAHTDRPACEVSGSLCLGFRASAPWPLYIVDRRGEKRQVQLQPGDLLIYLGLELAHWREPFVGDHQVQLFVHYVDKHGGHVQQRDDRQQKPDFREYTADGQSHGFSSGWR